MSPTRRITGYRTTPLPVQLQFIIAQNHAAERHRFARAAVDVPRSSFTCDHTEQGRAGPGGAAGPQGASRVAFPSGASRVASWLRHALCCASDVGLPEGCITRVPTGCVTNCVLGCVKCRVAGASRVVFLRKFFVRFGTPKRGTYTSTYVYTFDAHVDAYMTSHKYAASVATLSHLSRQTLQLSAVQATTHTRST